MDDNTSRPSSRQNTVSYKDANFECQIISNDDKFITETLDNLFNEQSVARRLEDLLSGEEIPPIVKEKLDKIFAAAKANKDKAAAAVTQNS